MKTVRSHLMVRIALGMVAGVLVSTTAVADDKPGHTDEKHHDHDAVAVEKEIAASLGDLSAADRRLAEAQRFCTMMEYSRPGAMGKPVFLCCKGCTGKAQANPEATLAKVEELKKAGEHEGHGDHEHDDHKHETKAGKKK